MNQGCIPSLFAVYGIYVAIVFYCCFKEVISWSKIIGIVLIVLCIIFLAFDKKESTEGESGYSAKEKRVYGGFAVLCSLIAPIIWTYKTYYLRKTIIAKLFTSTKDLAIDCLLVQGVLLTILFFVYFAIHGELIMRTFIEGQIVAVFFFIAGITSPICYDTGPGGPITALVSTAVVY